MGNIRETPGRGLRSKLMSLGDSFVSGGSRSRKRGSCTNARKEGGGLLKSTGVEAGGQHTANSFM